MLFKNPQNLQQNKATATQARHFDVDITTSVITDHTITYVEICGHVYFSIYCILSMAISEQLQLHVKVNKDRAFDKRYKSSVTVSISLYRPLYYHQHDKRQKCQIIKMIQLYQAKANETRNE
jgi:hypothetical protein